MIYPVVVGFLTLLVMAVTVFISLLAVAVRVNIFYCTLIPILLGELLLGVALLWQSFAKSRNKVIPLGMVGPVMLYLLFTFLMIIPFSLEMSFAPLLSIHLVGFVILVILMMAFVLAGQHSNSMAAQFAAKKHFQLEMIRFQQMYRKMLEASPELNAKIEQLAEAFRFASDSPAGAAEADAKVCEALAKLHSLAATGDVAQINAAPKKASSTMSMKIRIAFST